MSLALGTAHGSYSVIAKIGEGGMGEVYRAKDTKLDRDVALKVLPEAFTSDPDRLARFEREAKVFSPDGLSIGFWAGDQLKQMSISGGPPAVETLAAIAAAAGRQWDAAETHYETALRLADEMPFVSEQAEARYGYARMLVDRGAGGDLERARDLLETALAVYRRIGMPWHVDRTEALRRDIA
jgi:tetratricopeptide (TPR) repeat protein